jgi:hypothetical protein
VAECYLVLPWFSGDIFNDDNTQGMTVDDTYFLFILYILDDIMVALRYIDQPAGWTAYMEMEVFRDSLSL